MARKRTKYAAGFKAQVALAAVKEDRTANQLASKFEVNSTLVHAWKKQLLAGAESIFAEGGKATEDGAALQAELYEQIGRLKMELEWLKKKAGALG